MMSNRKLKSDSEMMPPVKVQEILRMQLSSLNCPDISILSAEFVVHHAHLCSMIRRTVSLAESNSILILGPRGCGKTALINNVIKTLKSDPKVKENLLIVHLNGMLHTDDRIALKDFARQLKLADVVKDNEEVTGTFAEIFSLILKALREERKQGCSILVCLEEFDLFCTHKSQILLYNLFDVSQSSQTPITVVGLTCRLDVIELLEKRVKSRFSHRQIQLFHQTNIDENLKVIQSLLTISAIDCKWNKRIDMLLKDKSVKVTLDEWFRNTLDYRTLKQMLFAAVIRVTDDHPFLVPDDIKEVFCGSISEGKSSILSGLSTVEILLVICMVNYTYRFDYEPFNFYVIYKEYQTAIKKISIQETPKSVIEKAYEHLQQVEIMQATEGRASHYQKDYRPMQLLVDRDQMMDFLDSSPNLPTSLKQLAYSTIAS